MAYNTADLVLVDQPASGVQKWMYTSLDAAATVLAANFISDAQDRGMLPGDIVTIRVASAESAFDQIITISKIVEAAVASVSASGAVLSTAPMSFTGDSGSGGVAGAVPAPAAGDAGAARVLGASGGWVTPSSLVNGQNLDNVARLGIGTTDTGNKLSVAGASSLFSNADGSVRVSLSKHDAADTASFLFQDNFSGRAEFGLCGNDDFTMKVSADGSAWNDGISIAANSGAVAFPNTGGFTGDSGSGGSVGLVPAPAAGDAAAGKFLKASGAWAQVAAGEITGLAASATIDTTNADNITAGTLPAARLPNPSGSALGGVQSASAGANQFMTGINTSGVPQFAQPSASDVSGLAAVATSGAYADLSGQPSIPVIPDDLASENIDNVARLGIGTTDTGNKLSVAGASSLFSNSAGSVQVSLSKNASGDTASFIFQDNFSGRAEFGLCGNDGFTMKVSPDGSAWTSAIVIDGTTGAVSLASSMKAAVVTYANLPASPSEGDEINVSDATVNTWGATISAGSGSYHVKARYNGSAWTVAGI